MQEQTSSNSLGENVPKLRFPEFEGEWEQRKLSDIATMHARIGWQNLRTSEFLDSGDYMLITGTDFEDGTVNYATCHYVEQERYEQDKHIQVRNGSILITKDGTLGKVAFVQGLSMPATLNAGVFNIEIKDTNEVDNKYLFQYLRAPFLMDYVGKRATGGTIKHLNQNILVDFPVVLPKKAEQEKIGLFFILIDKKIKKQRQLVDALKLYKRGLLSKLFPQEGENVPRYRFTGFTDAWEQRKLGKLAEIVGGGTPSTGKEEYWDGDIDWYAPAEISEQIYVDSSERKITEEGFNNSSTKKLPVGTVLFTSRAGIGKMAILRKESCTNQGFQSIVPHKNELDSYFIFSRSEELKRYGETVGAGSTFVEVSGKQMAAMELMMPPTIDEQRKIGSYFERIDHLITLHQRKQDFCEKVKLALLQQMFI